ncbi:MAG TPA: NAD(P)H-dependent glycerol-3-phosphate dehydrogenase [Rhodocyclaceae bacterium]|jgi:glycerol-3-phosphate dehydrogenase (NAD(P)+)|nr:NAD(P)H-dependent glycerol-3-phosphate dehydrogenase [Rhodocyclaceae bacterium]
MKIAVLGAGAWGTALALTFVRAHPVTLWVWDPAEAAALRRDRENRRFLSGHPFPAALGVEAEIGAAVRDADLALIATPVLGFRGTLRSLREAGCAVPVIWACKGLEAGTGKLLHQVVAEELGDIACAALSGPSFAEEVARGLPTAVTLASRDLDFARHWVSVLNSPRLRLYANDDVIGVEVGAAVKNILAIAAGISDGLGFGLNARAALLTRGLAEIARLGLALGGRQHTFMGLAGMGDVVLTCTGDLSRNRRVGLALAKGQPLDAILQDLGQTAEGVNTARAVASLAERIGVDMPITHAVNGILFEGLPADRAVEQLLARDPKVE